MFSYKRPFISVISATGGMFTAMRALKPERAHGFPWSPVVLVDFWVMAKSFRAWNNAQAIKNKVSSFFLENL
jgi:hypothetical protein